MTEMLGKKATDKVTGISGTITGYCVYLHGNDAVLVERLDKDGEHQFCWWDRDRLRIADA